MPVSLALDAFGHVLSHGLGSRRRPRVDWRVSRRSWAVSGFVVDRTHVGRAVAVPVGPPLCEWDGRYNCVRWSRRYEVRPGVSTVYCSSSWPVSWWSGGGGAMTGIIWAVPIRTRPVLWKG